MNLCNGCKMLLGTTHIEGDVPMHVHFHCGLKGDIAFAAKPGNIIACKCPLKTTTAKNTKKGR